MNKAKTQLKKLFTGYWEYLAVNAACKLNLFDLIKENKNSLQDLVTHTNANVDLLNLLLEALVENKYLEKDNEMYYLTETSFLLTDDNPESLKNACILWGMEHMDAWQNLGYTLKVGKPAFEKIYKQPFFDYLNENKERLDNYHKAMYEYARDDYKDICDKIDFKDSNIIMDVGGGYGALISIIAKQCPQIKAILFDRPEVISNVKTNSFFKIGGDFFVEIPEVADTIIMSRVIHDWNDDKANIILKNAYQALPENGILYLIENLTDKIEDKASLLSLNMRIMTNSFERTESEYKEIVKNAGFQYIFTKKINQLQYALKFKKQ